MRVKHAILYRHFDFVGTAGIALRLCIGILEKIETREPCVDVQPRDAQSMIMEP